MKTLFATTALLAFAATAGTAATISVSAIDVGSYHLTYRGLGETVNEDFEGFNEAAVADGFSTAVGSFATVGGVGTGGTVTNSDFTNDGTTLAVRDGNVYGRASTTSAIWDDPLADKFLDSNDTHGIAWTASLGGRMFDKILLTLRDGAEFGALMNITVDGETVSFAGKGNGDTRLVLIDFGQNVTSSDIRFANLNGANNLTNDGFSVDDIAVAVAPVPLPASSLLLLASLAGLGAMARRRKSV